MLSSKHSHGRKRAGFGLVLLALIALPVPRASAQQAGQGDGGWAKDGTLLPDFLRRQQSEDGAIDGAPATAPLARHSQDPLDDVHKSFTSEAVDARGHKLMQDPLQQAPATFRDDKFDQFVDKHNWLNRDDAAYEPLGIRRGSFTFYPELYSKMLVSDNVFASKQERKTDMAVEFTPTLRVKSDWNVHELELFASSSHKRWREFSSEDTDTYELRLRGRLDVTRRTSLEVGARTQQDTDGRGSNEQPSSAVSPAVTHQHEVYGQINHRFNRLGFRLRGAMERNTHDDVALNDGTLQRNGGRDFDERRLALRSSYEFSPRLTVFADGEHGWRRFKKRRDSEGMLQGSRGWLLAGGANLALSAHMDLSGRIGYVRTTPDERAHADIAGLFVDARMVLRPTRLMTATFNAQTEVDETIQSDSAGALKHSYGVELENDWTRRLSSRLSAAYVVSDYAGIDLIDRELTLGVDLDYKLGRSWVLDAGYQHVKELDGEKSRENIYQLGVKLRR